MTDTTRQRAAFTAGFIAGMERTASLFGHEGRWAADKDTAFNNYMKHAHIDPPPPS